MFDTLFDGMMAYQQLLMLMGGFFSLALGVLLAGNEVYWRTKAVRVPGIIAGVRQKGNVYYPVYRYQLPNGQIHEATSDIGSSGAAGKETGRALALLVFENDPTSARAAGNWAFGIIGLVLTLPGFLFLYLAFTRYPVTRMTGFVAIAMFCYAGLNLQRILKPRGDRVNLATWKAAMKQQHAAEMQGIPIVRIEDLVSMPEQQKIAAQQAKNLRIAAPLLIAGGLLLIWGGLHQGTKLADVLQYGVSAPGRVIEMKRSPSDNTSFPVVSFTATGGKPVTFQDATGENPPAFATGETVTVLYLPHDPEKSAMIDRGNMNYLGPLALLALGTLFAGIGAFLLMRNRKAAETPQPPV